MFSMLLTVLFAGAVLAADPCSSTSQACCNPLISPPQICPSGVACEECGGSSACECPTAPPTLPPSPGSKSDTRLTVVNGCQNGPLWIAHIVTGGVGPDQQDVKIPSGDSAQFHTGYHNGGLSATRFWPKMGCNSTGNNCIIGSSGGPGEACVIRVKGEPDDYSHCAPPVDTKFEATFAAPGSSSLDTVDMSLVDGYTLPFKFEVSGGSCARAGAPFVEMDCSGLSMGKCPSSETLDNKVRNLNAINPNTGKQGGCYSPCMKLTDDKWNPNGTAVAPDSAVAGQYCCAGAWGNPDTCNAGAVLTTNYLKTVKASCPAAYGYAYDDRTATIVCSSSTEYKVTFYCMQ